jgi:hypothetical protein
MSGLLEIVAKRKNSQRSYRESKPNSIASGFIDRTNQVPFNYFYQKDTTLMCNLTYSKLATEDATVMT